MGVNLAGTEGCVCIYLREGCTMLDSQQPLSKDLVTLLLLWKGELRSLDGKQNFSYVFISHLGSIIVTLLPALLPDLNPFPAQLHDLLIMSQVEFMLSIYSQMCDFYWTMVNVPEDKPLRKTDSSLPGPISCQ